MKYFKIVFFLFSISLSAQIKGVVKDSLTGNPIPYVNIWVEGENIGTTSEENGIFEIKTSKEKKLVFSAIGFQTKICRVSETSEIILNSIVYQLENVEISKLKYTKELEIGDSKKIHHKHLSGDKPWIYGKLFTYEPNYAETPFLKEIVFLSDSEKKDAKLKIRIFQLKDSLPDEDMLFEDVFVSVKKGMRKNVVDISKYKIKMPNNGVVIGLEWLIIEENKYLYEYTYNKIKQSAINYAPSLVVNYSEVENSFRYTGGKWKKSKINKIKVKEKNPWDNKVMVPAINIILTN
ncbi:carboxypeptidase-like regulatory domain-containing protein [Flavobacterium sp.]|uniref:carboxypeptidase-like regulatory domain-containing protein n=1 Tax=Flavobacterium sp. TaxID=239 RepID=UPI002605E8F1|nr:carboxypeptidase-like regulatory domain-containing protein [Flavobacterium sp.]